LLLVIAVGAALFYSVQAESKQAGSFTSLLKPHFSTLMATSHFGMRTPPAKDKALLSRPKTT